MLVSVGFGLSRLSLLGEIECLWCCCSVIDVVGGDKMPMKKERAYRHPFNHHAKLPAVPFQIRTFLGRKLERISFVSFDRTYVRAYAFPKTQHKLLQYMHNGKTSFLSANISILLASSSCRTNNFESYSNLCYILLSFFL